MTSFKGSAACSLGVEPASARCGRAVLQSGRHAAMVRRASGARGTSSDPSTFSTPVLKRPDRVAITQRVAHEVHGPALIGRDRALGDHARPRRALPPLAPNEKAFRRLSRQKSLEVAPDAAAKEPDQHRRARARAARRAPGAGSGAPRPLRRPADSAPRCGGSPASGTHARR